MLYPLSYWSFLDPTYNKRYLFERSLRIEAFELLEPIRPVVNDSPLEPQPTRRLVLSYREGPPEL